MPIPRSAILAGPCSIRHRGTTIQSQSDVEWRLDYGTFDVESSAQGYMSRRADDRVGRITFTPMGVYDAADTDGYRTIFHPYAADIAPSGTKLASGKKLIGSIFGADNTLGISAVDDVYFELGSAVLTRVPDLILSANKMIYGQAEFSCVAKDNQAWNAGTPNEFLKIGTAGAGGNPAFTRSVSRSRVITLAYTATWGDDLTSFYTVDGWTISFDLRTNPVTPDAVGTMDWLFQDMIVRARCRPIITDLNMKSKILAIEDSKMQRGADFADMVGGAGDLTIVGTDATGASIITFTLKRAVATMGGLNFASNNLRQGEVEWIATKTGADGDVLYTIT